MRNYIFLILVSGLLLGVSSAITVPPGIAIYSQITLSSSWSSVNNGNVQQMVNLTTSSFSPYIVYNKGFANFEYFYGNGTVIPAWIESNSSGKLITWIKIKNTTVTNNVYLGFASVSTNLLSNSGTTGIGEAPQISPTYAQYDDGANVFNFYNNFAGTSTPTGLTDTTGSGGTITYDNGLTIALSGPAWGTYVTTSSTFAVPTVVESLMNDTTMGGSSVALVVSTGSTLTSTSYAGMTQSSNFSFVYEYNNGGTSPNFPFPTIGTVQTADHSFNLYSLGIASGGTLGFGDLNYASLSGTSSAETVSPFYIGLQTTQGTANFKWLRTRAYPPNGVMPTATFSTPSSISLTISPNPATYSQSVTLTATCTPSTDTCAIDYPSLGTAIATGTGTATYTYPAGKLGVGSYSSFYANDITQSINSTPQTLTITQASAILNFTKKCTNTFVLNCNTTANITTYNNQVKGNLYLGNNLVGNTTLYIKNLNTTTHLNNNIGKQTYVFNSLSTTNYTANSITYNYTAIVPVYVQNSSLDPANTFPFATSNGAPTIIGRYPYKIYTTSPINSLIFSLNQSFNLGVQTSLQSKVANLSYVPVSTQLGGSYRYFVNESYNGNQTALQLNYTINMSVLKCQPSINTTSGTDNFQYFPIPLKGLIRSCWYSIPSYYEINTFKNASVSGSNLIDVKGSGTLTLNNNMEAFYTQFTPTVAFNLTTNNNLSVTSYTLQASKINISVTSTVPTTRQLINFSTYDGQFFTPINALSQISFNYLFNNYSLSYFASAHSNNTNYIWFTQSSFQNPNICLNNITFSTSASGHTTSINSYLLLCQTDTQIRNFKIYLNNVNSSLITFNIYKNGGGGYGGYGDFLYIYTGSSSQSLSLTQIYSIQQTVPFQIYLGTQQRYLFKLITPNNVTLVSTTLEFVNYQTPVNIYLPFNNSVPQTPIIQAVASCSYNFNVTHNFTITTCNGTDLYNMITQWHVEINRVTSYLNTSFPLQNYYNSNSSFIHKFNLTNNSWEYNIKVIGCAQTYCVQLYNNNYGKQQSIPYGVFGVILGIFFLLMAITGGYETPETAIAILILGLFILNAIGIMNMPIEVWIGIVIAGALVIWRVVSKSSRPSP